MKLSKSEFSYKADTKYEQYWRMERTNEQVGEVLLNAMGHPVDGKGPMGEGLALSVRRQPPEAITRRRITEPLSTGIRAIDGILTCGRGQRVGIFAGSEPELTRPIGRGPIAIVGGKGLTPSVAEVLAAFDRLGRPPV